MPQHLAHRSRSIAKQTLLGVIATLGVVTGASMALAADGDGGEDTPVVSDDSTTTTCPSDDAPATTETTDDTTVEDDTAGCDTDETSTTTSTTEQQDGDAEQELDEETELDEVVEPEDGEFRNHGEAVSKAAREDCEPGPEHGACVSEVARSNAGKTGAVDDVEEPTDPEATLEQPSDGPGGNGNGNAPSKGNKGADRKQR